MSSSATSSTDDPAPPPTAPSVAAGAEAATTEDANGRSPSRHGKPQSGKWPITDLRVHAAIVAALAVAAVALSQVGPSFSTVVNFFWPLLVSTGVFLAAVSVLRVISPPQADGDAADKAGSDLMDFVAGGSVGGHEEQHDDGAAEVEEAKDRDGREEEHEKRRDLW